MLGVFMHTLVKKSRLQHTLSRVLIMEIVYFKRIYLSLYYNDI